MTFSARLPNPSAYIVERRETFGRYAGDVRRYPGEFADEASAMAFAAARMNESCGTEWWQTRKAGGPAGVLVGQPLGIPGSKLRLTVVAITRSDPVSAPPAPASRHCCAADAFDDRYGILAAGGARESPGPSGPPKDPAAFGNEIGKTFV